MSDSDIHWHWRFADWVELIRSDFFPLENIRYLVFYTVRAALVKVLDTVHNFLYFVTVHKRAISSVACVSSHKFHPQRYRVYTLTLLSKVRLDTTNV